MIKIITQVNAMEKITTEEALNQTIDQFWETVPRVWNLIRSHLRTIAVEQFEISVGQFHVLRHVRKGLTSVRDIAEARQISPPAVSQEVEILVGKGLVTRREEANDRRFVHLALTAEGEDLLNQVFLQNRDWMKEKMAAMQEKDLELIAQGLTQLKFAFDPPMEIKPENPTNFTGM
jgi:DNA-binding MarR family transcriptional regulator